MADSPPHPGAREDAEGDPNTGSGPGTPPRTPRWVKVFGIIALVLILLVIALLLFGPDTFGPGQHGPSRHMPGGGGQSPPTQKP